VQKVVKETEGAQTNFIPPEQRSNGRLEEQTGAGGDVMVGWWRKISGHEQRGKGWWGWIYCVCVWWWVLAGPRITLFFMRI